MYCRAIVFVMLAVVCHYVNFSSAEEECLREFVRNKFESFKPQTNIQLENFRANGSTFFLEAEYEISELNILELQEVIQILSVSTDLFHDSSFRVEFVYNLLLKVEGRHTSKGTILSRRRFSGEGEINISFTFQANTSVDVKIQTTPSGYLDVLQISTDSEFGGYTTLNLYLENITGTDVFNEYYLSMNHVLTGVVDRVTYPFELRMQSAVEEFWRKQISETYLTDICIPPVLKE